MTYISVIKLDYYMLFSHFFSVCLSKNFLCNIIWRKLDKASCYCSTTSRNINYSNQPNITQASAGSKLTTSLALPIDLSYDYHVDHYQSLSLVSLKFLSLSGTSQQQSLRHIEFLVVGTIFKIKMEKHTKKLHIFILGICYISFKV